MAKQNINFEIKQAHFEGENPNLSEESMKPASKDWSTCSVFLLANCIAICYSVSNALIKDCQVRHKVSPFEILFAQSLVNMLTSAILAKFVY